MFRPVFFILFVCCMQYVCGLRELCGNQTGLSCTKEIVGQNSTDYSLCQMEVYPSDSTECGDMSFGPLAPSPHIGGVTLKPYILTLMHNTINPYIMNHTVLNITFSNIKWKQMKFRFQDRYRNKKNHCRNIRISNDATIYDQSVLYYDCYWTKTDNRDGQTHVLDFEASSYDGIINRGQYYFNVPSAEMLNPSTTEDKWKPFIYIEIIPPIMRLHIMPPPRQLKINSYRIRLISACGKATCNVRTATIDPNNRTDEVTYDFNFVGYNGSYSFVVTPLHDNCDVNGDGCQVIESPRITISNDPPTLNICIASITALIVSTLLAWYIILRCLRRYWCNDNYRLAGVTEIPLPPKILAVYSPVNRLHAETVTSFITYLRSEYGFDIMYDGDISSTSHGDPYIWAEGAFRIASHVLYFVGPTEQVNLYNNIYDKPIITPHKDVDTLLLSFVKSSRASRSPKDIVNVFFTYSDAQAPVEMRHAKEFKLLKDWQMFISYLSKNVMPKVHISRSEKGRCFIDDLQRAEKLLNAKRDEVVVNCYKTKNFDKNILL